MIKELCVVGHPSLCGGADTELLDQIKCWHKMGVKTYICHTGMVTPNLQALELEKNYNCEYIKPRQWHLIQGMHCISFCNGEFLENLKRIKKHAKTTTFVNCMTWSFQNEIKAQHDGYIDFHLYQTEHAYEKISKNLKHLGTYRPLKFKPYFDPAPFPYHDQRPNDHFRFGRLSRCDLQKFAPDQMDIYDKIQSPVKKSGLIMGWDHRIKEKLKIQTGDISTVSIEKNQLQFYKNYIQLVKEGGVSQQKFYDFCDVLITSSETFENLPRVGFECMATGTIMVVNNRGGWTIEVEDGATGMLCNSTEEFISKASFLANNPEQKEQIRMLAKEKLLKEWGLEESMKSWENVFQNWERR